MRMHYLLIVITLIFPRLAISAAESDPCVVTGRSFDSSLIDSMVSDFGIDEKTIVTAETKMELLSKNKVTRKMALFYAMQSRENKVFSSMKTDDLVSIYHDDNAMNLIVRYDYQNHKGKHNILVASFLTNDYECSVRFNGYLIVKREF